MDDLQYNLVMDDLQYNLVMDDLQYTSSTCVPITSN